MVYSRALHVPLFQCGLLGNIKGAAVYLIFKEKIIFKGRNHYDYAIPRNIFNTIATPGSPDLMDFRAESY